MEQILINISSMLMKKLNKLTPTTFNITKHKEYYSIDNTKYQIYNSTQLEKKIFKTYYKTKKNNKKNSFFFYNINFKLKKKENGYMYELYSQ